MKISFLGFCNSDIECIHGDYKFLRNCGSNAFYSKYCSEMNKDNDEKLHRGEIQLAGTEHEKNRKHFNWEGGPSVGIKALLYNLSIRDDVQISVSNHVEGSYDYYYVHYLPTELKKALLRNKDIIDNKLIFSIHFPLSELNDFKNIKYKRWSHTSCENPSADCYLSYPIHKTLYEQYPLTRINNNRDKILIYTKRSSPNRGLYHLLNKQKRKIVNFFNKNNYECLSLDYGSFRRSDVLEYANQSKICLYLSFYDCGALAIGEITFMGCYIIGFINNNTYQKVNHSFAPSGILENKTGEYIHDFARICDKNKKADNYLVSGCKKVLNILKNRNLNHIEIAKKTREYLTEDRFIETIFT